MVSGSGALLLRTALAFALAFLDPVIQLDHQVQGALQATRSPALDPFMQAVTDVGRPQVVLGLLLGIAISGAPAGPATARRAIMALLPTNLVVELTKRSVNRGRPDGERKRSNASFPSSHAANAFAAAFVFAHRWPRLSVAFYLFAALTAFSRVYLNRHFTTDAIAGALIGVGCAWAAVRYLKWPFRTEETAARS